MPVHHDRGSTRVTCSDVASATDAGSNAGPEHAASATAAIAINIFLMNFLVEIPDQVGDDVTLLLFRKTTEP